MEPIDRVRKLRAVAERTTFPAEAEAFKAKADAVMAAHDLTEEMVMPARRAPRPPIQQGQWVTMVVNGVPINMPMPPGFPPPPHTYSNASVSYNAQHSPFGLGTVISTIRFRFG
jgi:hypothetical protein